MKNTEDNAFQSGIFFFYNPDETVQISTLFGVTNAS